MKVQIDIAHPAHIHYFRNFAGLFENKGHEVLFSLRNKGIITDLAKFYNLKYQIRSNESSNKLIYGIKSISSIYKIAKKFNPDLFLDMGTIFASPVAKFFQKPYLAFEDTESSYKARFLHMPFTDVVLTPKAFSIDLGSKQLKFDAFMELMYLNEKYYKPDPSIKKILDVGDNEKYVIMRFVSWAAHHDAGLSGLSIENKINAVKQFSKYARVFISDEKGLSCELKQYHIPIPPERIHDALYYSTLFFGEGATMASESALLGTPTIYINHNWLGYTNEEERHGLLFSYKANHEDQINAIEKGIELLKVVDIKTDWRKRRDKFLADKIDPTAFLVWFVENYPNSAVIMRKDPGCQYSFK